MPRCSHETYHYVLATNEDGWTCDSCSKRLPGEPPGYRPDLDRAEISEKVESVLMALDTAGLIYIGSASYGDGLSHAVSERCRKNNRYDQYSIILYVMEELAPDHGDYWGNIADGIQKGADPRERCWCGKLSTGSGKNGPHCSLAHDVDFRGRVRTVRRRSKPGQDQLFPGSDSAFNDLLASPRRPADH